MSKFEITKKEEDSPPHSTSLCPPVKQLARHHIHTTTQGTTSITYILLQPLHTHYITCHLQNDLRTADTHRTTPPPPRHPYTTSSTSSEDPVILTTNVPILPKARPGHPPLNTTWVGPPQSPNLHPTMPTSSHTHFTAPTRGPLRVTIPRPHHNGHLLPFNFSSDIKHYLNPTAHRTRQPLLPPTPSPPCPAPPANYQPTTTTNTTTVFPPVPPIPDAPLTDQQAATLHHAILRIARQAAAAAAAEMTSR